MIFKRLFTPQHTHSDPEVRKQAIEKLDPQVAGDKSKLHELAFNDADAQVSLAALDRLKSFPLWLKMSQIAADSKIRKQAQAKVLAILTDEHSELISPELRRATILEAKETSIVRHMLEQTDMFCDEPEVVSELLARIGDSVFSRQYTIEKASPEVRSFIIARMGDIDELAKLNRYSELADHKEQIDQRIVALRTIQQRPIQLKESLRLNLSKYKALTEQSEYAAVASKSAELRLIIEADIAELGEFDAESAHLLEQKYSQISTAIDSVLARLYPSYQAQQEAQVKAEHLQQWQRRYSEISEQAQALMREGFESVNDEIGQRIETIRLSIKQLLIDAEDVNNDQQTVQSLHRLDAKLEQLPRYQVAQAQLNAVVTNVKDYYQRPKELADYDASNTVFESVKQQVKQVLEQVDGGLPEELQSSWLTLRNEWQHSLKSSRKQADAVMRTCQSKLRAAQGLYKEGKFKAVLAIDKKISATLSELPKSYVQRIQRQLDAHQAIIAELTEWQTYVAAPRLPELVAEIQALAAQQPDDIDERRRQLQVLRKNWNSLQVGNQQQAEDLQQEFDSAAEKAFAPVQQYQAEQNTMRANNKAQAEALLRELEQLNPNVEDENEFAKQYSRLNQRWFALGEIGRSEWRDLKQRYAALSKPLKQRVTAVHTSNAEKKERLIKRAEALLQESTNDVVKQVKSLQQQWQDIGFAGSKHDQSLWKTFRGVNDQVFAQLKQHKQSLQQTIDTAHNEATIKLNTLQERIESGELNNSDLSSLGSDISAVMKEFMAAVEELDSAVVRRPMQQLRRLSDILLDKIKVQKKASEQEKFNSQLRQLFDYLQDRIGEAELLDEMAPSLPGVSLRASKQNTLSRHIITVRLEIITESASPKQDSEIRSQQQVQLMSEKLSTGELADKWQLFALWLSCGPLGKEDEGLLQRVQAILMPEPAEEAKRVV